MRGASLSTGRVTIPTVAVSKGIGEVYTVAIEPAVPLLDTKAMFGDLPEALGYGAAIAAWIEYRLVDETGFATPHECAELVAWVTLAFWTDSSGMRWPTIDRARSIGLWLYRLAFMLARLA